MAYSKTIWVDRNVEYPGRYDKTNETTTSVELTASPGTVTAAGTSVNATNLNKLETGVEAAASTADTAKAVTDTATDAATANTVVKRDASGRFKAAAPSASTDVAIKSTVDAVSTVANAALPKAGGTLTGPVLSSTSAGRQFGFSTWGDVGANADGRSHLFNNCYTDASTNKYRYSNSHASLGARGIRLGVDNGIEYFDTGAIATTADAEFTPVWQSLKPSIFALLNGATFTGAVEATGQLKLKSDTPGGLVVEGITNANEQVAIGFDTTNNRAVFTAVEQSVAFRDFWFNPNGNIADIYLTSDQHKVWHTNTLRDNSGVLELYTSGAWQPVGGVKSVQRGTVNFGAADEIINVTVSAVDTAKAYIPGFGSKTTATSFTSAGVRAELTSTTNIKFDRAGTSDAVVLGWQLVESY